MHPYRRADRVANLIQREIAMMLEHELSDPRLRKVTITRIVLSDDLKQAKVYFSLIGTEYEKEQALNGFLSAKGTFKRGIASRLYLRFIPELEFCFDRGFEHAQRIEELILKIHKKDEKGNPEDTG